ncbi:MAG: ACT domain-containing protein [Kiritimatiellae bacterium]|nr:ACT domain-containing protein [Kiritimatiellia bacterium]
MKIRQLSVFLENKPGHLNSVCRALAKEGINILTLSLADTQQFGILRLIIKECDSAREILEKEGAVVKVTEVVAAEVDDKPGGLADILEALEKGGVNIEYMYAFAAKRGERAVLVFRFDDPDAAIQTLQRAGENVLGNVDLFEESGA